MALNRSRTCPVTILHPSDALLSTVDSLILSTREMVATSQFTDSAQRFDPPLAFNPVVEEAVKLYQKAKDLREPPRISTHLAVLQKSSYIGRIHDALVVPLENRDSTVNVRDESGSNWEIKWIWTNFLFVQRLTHIDVAEGQRVGAVIVHFQRQTPQ
ncbi:hypothetical protein BJY00DRAFT_278995 [Aspergillus carlsbadensis]|nr:hypothetical protein BJY00DRAFT_278995 [Aspergillus carlsbadensis]